MAVKTIAFRATPRLGAETLRNQKLSWASGLEEHLERRPTVGQLVQDLWKEPQQTVASALRCAPLRVRALKRRSVRSAVKGPACPTHIWRRPALHAITRTRKKAAWTTEVITMTPSKAVTGFEKYLAWVRDEAFCHASRSYRKWNTPLAEKIRGSLPSSTRFGSVAFFLPVL